MASKKSIADQILEGLQKEKEAVLSEKQTKVLDFIKKQFPSNRFKLTRIKSDSYYSFPADSLDCAFDSDEFKRLAQTLGFKCTIGTSTDGKCFSVSIPKAEKGKKRTPAQTLMYEHNEKVNAKLKELRKAKEASLLLARKEKDRVWTLIKERKFDKTTDNEDGTFTLSLILNEERGGDNGDQYLLKFLSSRAFPNAEIKENTLLITLGKKN